MSLVVVSWWGRPDQAASADSQGVQTDGVMPIIIQAAETVGGLKIAFHLEPYPGKGGGRGGWVGGGAVACGSWIVTPIPIAICGSRILAPSPIWITLQELGTL